MLHVTYEAVDDLAPGRLARIDESRGRIRIRLDRREPLRDVIRQLNTEVDDLMSLARWFQLWEDEIVGRDTPGAPLSVVYLLHLEQPNGAIIQENKGLVSVHIDPALSVAQFAAALNPASKLFLAGGRWFQLYAGEIIDIGPEPAITV
jgi:hypothetical protein